jgi:hypothetical protein
MLLRRVKRSHEEAFASKREAFLQGKTNTSCLLHSSEKNGKKGLTVCDFPGEALPPNGTIHFFSHTSELKHFGGNRGAIHPGLGRRGSCHRRDLEGQAHHTVLESVVLCLDAVWLD